MASGSLYEVLEDLEQFRRERHHGLDNRPMGQAVNAVTDELIRRTRAAINEIPADTPATSTPLQHHDDEIGDIVALIIATWRALSPLIREGLETVEELRQPFVRFITRVESESYDIAEDFTVTDNQSADDPDRTGTARDYQERLIRMVTVVVRLEEEFAQRIRDVLPPALRP